MVVGLRTRSIAQAIKQIPQHVYCTINLEFDPATTTKFNSVLRGPLAPYSGSKIIAALPFRDIQSYRHALSAIAFLQPKFSVGFGAPREYRLPAGRVAGSAYGFVTCRLESDQIASLIKRLQDGIPASRPLTTGDLRDRYARVRRNLQIQIGSKSHDEEELQTTLKSGRVAHENGLGKMDAVALSIKFECGKDTKTRSHTRGLGATETFTFVGT